MKFSIVSIALGFVVGIAGFLIVALAGERHLGMSVFLIGFLFVVAGLASLVFTAQPSGSRGTGISIAAGGFLVSTLGGLISFIAPSITSPGNMIFYIGSVIMLVGIIFHVAVVVKSKGSHR